MCLDPQNPLTITGMDCTHHRGAEKAETRGSWGFPRTSPAKVVNSKFSKEPYSIDTWWGGGILKEDISLQSLHMCTDTIITCTHGIHHTHIKIRILKIQ